MPTYVYKFIDSGETIEVQQAFTDEALTSLAHPSDGKVRPVKKVFTPVGVSFKGGGFYKTDSRSGASSTAAAPATPAGSSSDGSSAAPTTPSTAPSSAPASAPASTPAPAPASTPAGTPASTPAK
jgi:predicted nucleic acid-binding Zn ribbon protein